MKMDETNPTNDLYHCKECNYLTKNKYNYKTHTNSKRHINNITGMKIDSKEVKLYKCELCNFYTARKNCYKNHLNTNKHQNHLSSDESEVIGDVVVTQNMIMELLCQNKKLMDVVENGTNNMTNCHNNTNTNTNNTSNTSNFNLQVFLNETCKNAINMKDFIESIEVTITDLKTLGKKGYVEGISGLMIDKLSNLDVTMRPIHSSDVKRETIYIKENDAWEKDNEQKERLKKVIWDITKLETCALAEKYRLMYPQCQLDRNSKEHNEYWKIFHNAMGGAEKDIDILHSKVIKRIVDNVSIGKECAV